MPASGSVLFGLRSEAGVSETDPETQGGAGVYACDWLIESLKEECYDQICGSACGA